MVTDSSVVEPDVDFYNLFIDSLIKEYFPVSASPDPFQKRSSGFMDRVGIILYIYESSQTMLL